MTSNLRAINRILETKPTITGPCFVYHMPKWAALTLKGVIFLFGIATFYLAFHEQGTTPIFIIGFLYFLSACFLLTAIHPKAGRETIYFTELYRDSVENGNAVTFRNNCGEEVRGVVVDAKVDSENGRGALMVEEQATGAVYFARYNHRGGKSSCGDLVTWHLKRGAIEELRRNT